MHLKNKLLYLFLLLLVLLPLPTYAYSQYVIPGGETVGIKVNSKGVMVVGFYPVDNHYIGKDAGFNLGDIITKVNNVKVNSIEEMVSSLEGQESNIKVTIDRNNESKELTLNLKLDKDNVYKTGLYVKDKINGIGTLSYIDPVSKIYGALGHEIDEKNTMQKFEIKDGTIFKAEITSITKSQNGTPGEKEARFFSDTIYGTIKENTKSGIFGVYEEELPNKNAIEVAQPNTIKLGKAYIRTVISGDTVEEFEINILKLDSNNKEKNILFEITDQNLLDKTGGVVQGMSGSPIIQNDKLIGAVTHVVVNDSKKGYGIFITTMLDEGEN